MEGLTLWDTLWVPPYIAILYCVIRGVPRRLPAGTHSREQGLLGLAVCFWLFGHIGAFIPWSSNGPVAAHTVTAVVRVVASLLILRILASPSVVHLTKPRPLWIPAWGLGAYICYLPLLALVSHLRGSDIDQEAARNVMDAGGFLPHTVLFIGLVIVTPFFEELLFRGLLQRVAVREMGPGAGIIMTALAFMLVHPRGVWFDVFTLGVLLGFVCYQSRNLWTSILIHMAHNALAFLVFSSV